MKFPSRKNRLNSPLFPINLDRKSSDHDKLAATPSFQNTNVFLLVVASLLVKKEI